VTIGESPAQRVEQSACFGDLLPQLLQLVRQCHGVIGVALATPVPAPFDDGGPIRQLVDLVEQNRLEQRGLCHVSGVWSTRSGPVP
jgi:hypothetical protein